MKLLDILDALEKALPVLGTATGNPEIAQLASQLIDISEKEVSRRMTAGSKTRAETLADAKATFIEARKANEELKALGH